MKKIISVLALTAVFSLVFITKNYAQDEWTHGKTAGIYSVGLGGTDAIGVGGSYGVNYYGYTVSRISPVGLSINASGEYKVYKFIGLGWQTGLDFFFSNNVYYYGGGSTSTTIGIPFIAKANVHILDAIGGVSIADKLDVYAGLNFGGGPAIAAYNTYGASKVSGFIQVGPTVGVRYWFNKVAVFGEFGWGATFANAGVTF